MLEMIARKDPGIYMAMFKVCLARFVACELMCIGAVLAQHEDTVFGWKSGGDTP